MESKIMNPEIKTKINRIDYELKEFFENVYIKDKFYKTGFFEITANLVSYIKESRDHKRVEVKIIINQPDLLTDPVKWSYSTNPLNENALWIDRVSNFDNLSEDIIQIAKECRFDESYLMDLEPVVDVINESTIEEVIEKEFDFQDTLLNILENYKVQVNMKQSELHSVNENLYGRASDRIVRFYHKSDIKVSDKFKIEAEMMTLENVNWCLFREEYIEVNYTSYL